MGLFSLGASQMLIKGVIFARMSPDEKHELVERLQGLGYTVCFCGGTSFLTSFSLG
jgi:hypothetical protein